MTTATFILWWKRCGRRTHFPVVKPQTAIEIGNMFLLCNIIIIFFNAHGSIDIILSLLLNRTVSTYC